MENTMALLGQRHRYPTGATRFLISTKPNRAPVQFFIFDAGDQLIASHISNERNCWLERYSDDTFWDANELTLHVPYLDSDRDIKNADKLPDAIGVGLETVISTRLETCLRSFRYDSTCRFCPLTVINRRGDVLTHAYSLLLSKTWHNVLDAPASNATLFDDGAIDELDNWVLASDAIPPFDWWYAHEHSWIINETVLASMNELGITNARTVPITTT